MSKYIYLGWAHAKSGDSQNFGDELSPYLVKQISKKKIFHIPVLKDRRHLLTLIAKRFVTLKFTEFIIFTKILFGTPYILSLGSILQFYKMNGAIVWGSGIIGRSEKTGTHSYKAVRGPLTRQILLNSGHKNIPQVYGDPALILKKIYRPKPSSKKFKIGIIPHIIHFKNVINTFPENDQVLIIDLNTSNIHSVIDQICSCEVIFSSSLHGVIVPHTYGVPALWVDFSNEKLMGDNMKFEDYFLSVELSPYEAIPIDSESFFDAHQDILNKYQSRMMPHTTRVDNLIDGLLNNLPF